MGNKRQRRADREIFLDALSQLSKGQQTLIGNVSLRDELGWEEEKYERIKGQLFEENQLISGRGRGGSVGLATAPGTSGLKLFVSYSHKDEKLKNDVLAHLKPLERLNLITSWHDGKINPGEHIDKVVQSELGKCDIILLLVSIDFINSLYCYEVELETAMELHTHDRAVVIPIILRNCLWHHTVFSKLKALPKDGKAVVSWQNQDDALTDVAENIRLLATGLMGKR